MTDNCRYHLHITAEEKYNKNNNNNKYNKGKDNNYFNKGLIYPDVVEIPLKTTTN